MADIEAKVRKAVSDFLVTAAIGFCEAHPNLTDELMNAGYLAMEKKIDEFALNGKISIEEAYSTNELMKEEIGFKCIGYDAGEDYAGEIEHGWLNNAMQHKTSYERFVTNLEEKGISLPDHLKKAYEVILGKLDRRERIIASLVSKAEKEGFEIISDETVKAAFKSEFGTKEDYINEYRSLTKEVIKFKEMEIYAPPEALLEGTLHSAAEDAFAEGLAEGRINTLIRNEAEKIFG